MNDFAGQHFITEFGHKFQTHDFEIGEKIKVRNRTYVITIMGRNYFEAKSVRKPAVTISGNFEYLNKLYDLFKKN